MTENEIGSAVIASAMKVHTRLGPGLLESAYSVCLAHEMTLADQSVRQEIPVSIRYGGVTLQHAFRLDLLVNGKVVIEVKAQEVLLPVHRAQLLSYLKLGGFKLGYLLNFNVSSMRDGIARLVNGL